MASTNNGNWNVFGNNRNKSGPRPTNNRGFPSAFGGQAGGRPQNQRRSNEDYYQQRDRLRIEEAKRKEEEETKARELNDVNFPSLGSSFAAASSSGHTWIKPGSELAKAWNEASEEQQMIEKIRKQREDRKQYQSHGLNFPLPMRRAVVRDNYYEEEEEHEEEEVRTSAGNSTLGFDESGWTTVDSSKVKKNTTGIWKKVETETHQDSVWGNDEEQATDDSVW